MLKKLCYALLLKLQRRWTKT